MTLAFIRAGVPLLFRAGSPALLSGVAGGGSSGGGGGGVTFGDVAVMVIGQSNANFTFSPTAGSGLVDSDANNAGLAPVAAEGVKFFTSATSCQIDAGGGTMFSGDGLYPGPGALGSGGSWLLNPNTASGGGPAYYPAMMTTPANFVDPSLWAWDTASGSNGAGFLAYVAGLTSGQVTAIQGLWIYWHESDSSRSYAEKATYKSALLRLISLIRTQLGKTVAQLPVFDWGCMPSAGDDQGMCMVREVVFELAANAANNFWIILPQAGDCNPRWNATMPDSYHADDGDYGRWVRRAALPAARAMYAAAGDATAIPSDVGSGLGPAIIAASIAANVVTLTVQHDIGTDFATFSAGAAAGAGWMLMDGGSVTLPGNLIPGVAAARVDATHIAVTFAGIPCNPAGAVAIFYPYGNNRIGNPAADQTASNYAITDNAATITRPTGWDAGATLGDVEFNQDVPLQMPMTVTGTGSAAVASCGMLLGTAAANLGPYGWNLQNFNLPASASGGFAPGAQMTATVDDGSTQSPAYTSPASMRFGVTSSRGVLPTSWVPQNSHSGNIWAAYVTAPSTAGTYYIVAEGLNSSGGVVSRLTGAGFTVT